MFGYLGMLIKFNVIRKVVVSFLPVGHTHEDVDQFFSRISVHLRQHDAVTIEKLAAEVEKVKIVMSTCM